LNNGKCDRGDLEGNAASISQNFEIRDRELEKLLLVGIKLVCDEEAQYVTAIPQIAHKLRLRLHEISNMIAPHNMIGAFKSADCKENGYLI
jgi:hypothetical protein